MLSLKEMVSGNKKVKFKHYRLKELWYETEDGFMFPVPIEDTGEAYFLPEDKAMLFMRYIRKQLDEVNKENQITISEKDFNHMVDVINNPPEPNESLKKLFR